MREQSVRANLALPPYLGQQFLGQVPGQFAAYCESPAVAPLLETVLRLCPRGERVCEAAGNGFATTWLGQRGARAECFSGDARQMEIARQNDALLGGAGAFRTGDPFRFFDPERPRSDDDGPLYSVVFHQGLLGAHAVPAMRAILAQEAACSEHVVFSLAAAEHSGEGIPGNCRMPTLEAMEHVLKPFEIEELRYYGPEGHERDYILCILKGRPPDDALRALMTVPEKPYQPGITAIVHTRNEGRRLAACLERLVTWADKIIVCDMLSDDNTAAIAKSFGATVITHPLIKNFDRSRNISAMFVETRHTVYIDADEWVPPSLAAAWRAMALDPNYDVAGLLPPFKHFFRGHWLQSLGSGFTSPRFFKTGRFVFNARLHGGAEVDGKVEAFAADDRDKAIIHHSYDSISHYIEKMNRYTDGEAANLHRDGRQFHWQKLISRFVGDFAGYYDRGVRGDAVPEWQWALMGGTYRLVEECKLFELRDHEGKLTPEEHAVPASTVEMLRYALAVAEQLEQQKHQPAPPNRPQSRIDGADPEAAALFWTGPDRSPSGYGEECRQFLFAFAQIGLPVAAPPQGQVENPASLGDDEIALLDKMAARPLAPGFIQVSHNIPSCFGIAPEAGFAIGRTMFETDRLPPETVRACNSMGAIMVPSEFNRESFANAGVDPDKLLVLPGCIDPAPYARRAEPTRLTTKLRASGRFIFLSVFDWTRHKGWDVLLRAFLEEFRGQDDVLLVLKVWSALHYGPQGIQGQAAELAMREFGCDLHQDDRVRFVHERLSSQEMIALYQAADAFVLPSRGEGWGRPLMEAMACGVPAIASNWSGNTQFMSRANSFLLDYELQAVTEEGWREIPIYRGHRWAEPSGEGLRDVLRRVYSDRDASKSIGELGRREVAERFNPATVSALIVDELARLEGRHGLEPRFTRLAASRAPAEPEASTAIVIASAESVAAPEVESPLILPPGYRRGHKIAAATEPFTVCWEGEQFAQHSLAKVNNEMSLALMASGRVDLTLVADPPRDPELLANGWPDPSWERLARLNYAPLGRPVDIHVQHFFPNPFIPRPGCINVLIQPWEYGTPPLHWIEPIRRGYHDIWCNSQSVMNVYRAGGIDQSKLHIVPLGIDPRVFNPQAPPYIFTTEPGAARLNALRARMAGRTGPHLRPFTFLFVGGTLHRKGIDILIQAYLLAFSGLDDVVLVVKDTGTRTVYREGNSRDRLLALAGDLSRPPIVYLDDEISASQLAGIYTAADCLVMPYRGEGFCLPVPEAMACGAPVVVPLGGPTDDFVDETVGWRVPAQKRPIEGGCVGEWECAGEPWMLEIDPETLARTLREVYGAPQEAARRGAAGARRARQNWTWKHSADKAIERLEALCPPAKTRDLARQAVGAIADTLALPRAARRAARKAIAGPVAGTRVGSLATPRGIQRKAGRGWGKVGTRGRPRISLCMIVKNEERVLAECLKSAKQWFDEIIVIDTGSTDLTVAIALEHGARVEHFEWCDDFSAARNYSLQFATGDWIFWMDADDTLPEACGRKLRELVTLAPDRVTAYIVQVHIPPPPGDVGFTIVDHVKLFRNLPQLRFEHRIHEQILESIQRIGGIVERSDAYVVHSGYDYSPEGQKRKRERDLKLLALDLIDYPDHPFVLFNIGMTYYHMKEYDKAEPALLRSLELCKPHESIVRKLHAMLSGCRLDQGDVPGAVARVEAGLTRFPRDPELLFRAGVIFAEAGDLARAVACYLRLLNDRETGHIDSLDVTMIGFKAYHNLAGIYLEMGRLAEAREQFENAVRDHPGFVPSWLGLRETLSRMGRVEEVNRVEAELARLMVPAA